MPRMALDEYLRSWKIESFSVMGDRVRIGSRDWRVTGCRCGLERCDGWSLAPLDPLEGLRTRSAGMVG